MESLLRPATPVAFDALFLDPNNPRLAPEDAPGYDDADALFDHVLQARVQDELEAIYKPDELREAILSQGWLPIDSVVVWEHPKRRGAYVVVEGNTRTLALRQIRARLKREQEKLERMESRKRSLAPHDLDEQRARVQAFERAIADTEQILVVPIAADSVADLERVLPRVLAVRHITAVKGWGNYAEDLWLLRRYHHLFEDTFPGQPFRWENSLIRRVADEASLGTTKAKRQMKAASLYSHFKVEHEDELPNGTTFKPSDYYLFENVVAKPAVRDLFRLGEDDLHLSDEAERALFAWTFARPRDEKDDEGNDNPNTFYRHENLVLFDQMKRYDDKHRTSFAARFDPADPERAPSMRKVEADYRAHMAQKKSQDVLDELARRLDEIGGPDLRHEGEVLKALLHRVRDTCDAYLVMIGAVEAAESRAAA